MTQLSEMQQTWNDLAQRELPRVVIRMLELIVSEDTPTSVRKKHIELFKKYSSRIFRELQKTASSELSKKAI